ncbi:helix-turn-helix domain-containing protein [Paenibacillus sp. GCM10027626]|uniref:response regulator transcription factor n=1 Tax=Paenibacillus sp. GCM10027626 TaxID=3273411 RepID=UPI00363F162A
MLKLIVAEDEIWMREALRTVIDWEQLGIEYAGDAGDGAEALALIEAVQPDIVLADIQMPVMDGLALMEELVRRGISARVIIISAYRNFDYAKKAVQLGAFDYILKPVYEDQLMEVLTRCLAAIAEQSREKGELQRMQGVVRESLPLARQQLLELLIHAQRYALSDLPSMLQALQIPLDIGRTGVLCIIVYDWGAKGEEENGQTLLRYAIGNIAEEVLKPDWHVVTCLYSEGEKDALLFMSPLQKRSAEEENHSLRKCGEEVIRNVRQYLGIEISIGTAPCDSLTKVPQTAKIAIEAASQALFEGSGRLFEGRGQVAPQAVVPIFPAGDWETRVLMALRMNKEEQIAQLMDEFSSYLAALKDKQSAFEAGRRLRRALLQLYEKWMSELQPEGEQLARFLKIKGDWMASRWTIAGLKERVLSALAVLSAGSSPPGANKRLAEQAMAYIRERYKEGVTLNDMAAYLHMSPWHFSKVFHEAVGITFSKFVLQIKMNEAKRLLAQTHMKVYEIAEAAGYQDARHFVKTFKEVEGMTPGQYRKL